MGEGSMGRVTVRAGKISIEVIDEGQLMAVHRAHNSQFEPVTLRAWTKLIKPGCEVFDVGAHTGIFSIVAAKLGARPVAIEPLPFLVERMKENAAINGVEFTICEAAAYKTKGEADIGYMAHIHHPYGGSLLRTEKPNHTKLRVKTVRLDDFKMSNVRAIKIDVERAEIDVLRGAPNTIRRWRPAIILEALNERAVTKTTEFLKGYYGPPTVLDRRNLMFQAAF